MTMQTIAVIGAGPGVGRAVAERFGRGGYQVALLARDTTNLNGVADYLAERGVTARTYRADVLDRSDLAGTLATIGAEFGPIDVLEYSPVPPVGSMRRPRDIDADNELFHLDFAVLGAVAAVQAVLPGMIARRHGSLLFTTAPSAERPMQMTGSFGVAGGALLNYVRLLHDDLAADNVYVGAVWAAEPDQTLRSTPSTASRRTLCGQNPLSLRRQSPTFSAAPSGWPAPAIRR